MIFPNSLQLVTTKDSDSTKTNPTNVPLITYTNTAKLYKLADLLEENEESEAFDADSYPITAMAYRRKAGDHQRHRIGQQPCDGLWQPPDDLLLVHEQLLQ